MELDGDKSDQPNKLQILYGVEGRYQDVTRVAGVVCIMNDVLSIPETDFARAHIFGDHVPGVLKHIIVRIGEVETRYNQGQQCVLPLVNITLPSYSNDLSWFDRDEEDPAKKLANIHAHLKLFGGSMKEEYPEQMMAAQYIKPTDRVLELGSNIGRNTLTIATLLEDQSNLVTLESDPVSYDTLMKNKTMNGYKFQSINAALSSRKLAQNGWITVPYDTTAPHGFKIVNTISYEEMVKQYGVFDTLVADCEGALYYILQDTPQLLDNITTIIVENDYTDINQYLYTVNMFKDKGFETVFQARGPWGPCSDVFYQVWTRRFVEIV